MVRDTLRIPVVVPLRRREGKVFGALKHKVDERRPLRNLCSKVGMRHKVMTYEARDNLFKVTPLHVRRVPQDIAALNIVV